MAWRSRSLMTAEESSRLRSVNRVVICGVVTRMMTNAKKPISAAVTATIAISREAPKPLRKPTRLCKPTAPQDSVPSGIGPLGNYCLRYGFDMVNEGKRSGAKVPKRKKSASQGEADFHQMIALGALLAILLNSGGSKPRKAVLVDGELPGQEFVDGQRIAATVFLEGQQAAAHSGNDFGLATDDPSLRSGCGQIRDRQRTAIGPDDVFDPRAMGLCHGVLTNSQPLNSRHHATPGRLKFT